MKDLSRRPSNKGNEQLVRITRTTVEFAGGADESSSNADDDYDDLKNHEGHRCGSYCDHGSTKHGNAATATAGAPSIVEGRYARA